MGTSPPVVSQHLSSAKTQNSPYLPPPRTRRDLSTLYYRNRLCFWLLAVLLQRHGERALPYDHPRLPTLTVSNTTLCYTRLLPLLNRTHWLWVPTGSTPHQVGMRPTATGLFKSSFDLGDARVLYPWAWTAPGSCHLPLYSLRCS